MTGEELAEILEREQTQEIELRETAARKEQTETVRRLVTKVERLLPEVRPLLLESSFGHEALDKLQGCLDDARAWVAAPEGEGADVVARLEKAVDLCVTLQERGREGS